MTEVKCMGDIELTQEAAKVNDPAVKELILRFVESRHQNELNKIRLDHQVDMVSILRRKSGLM